MKELKVFRWNSNDGTAENGLNRYSKSKITIRAMSDEPKM